MARPWLNLPGPAWLRWIIVALLVLLAALLALRILATTAIGRGLVESQVDGLSIAGQTVEIDDLQGDLLGRFSIGRVRVTDAEGEWLTLDRAQIHWSPMALLGRRLEIDSLDIRELHAARRPALVSSRSPSDGGGSPLRSYGLGDVNITTLRLDEGVAGPDVLAALSASLETTIAKGTLALALQPKSPSGDRVEGKLEWGGEIPLSGALTATGPENGLLANLISPTRRGPLTLSIKGSGSPESWICEAVLEIGDEVPLRIGAAGEGATSTAGGVLHLGAFEATQALTPYLGGEIALSLEQAETLSATATSAQLDATLSAPWNAETLRPDLEAVSLEASLKQPFLLEDEGLAIGGASVSGMAGLVGDQVTFDGDISLSDPALPGLAIGSIEAQGRFRLNRASNMLSLETDIGTRRFAPDSMDLAAYAGPRPSLSLVADISLDTLTAQIASLTLDARAARLGASGKVSTDRDSIDLQGSLTAKADAPQPKGLVVKAAAFEVRSLGSDRLAITANLPLRLAEPPHPLLAGEIDTSFNGVLEADNTLLVDTLELAGEEVSASATGTVSGEAMTADITARVAAFEQGDLALEPSTLALSVSGPFDALTLSGDLTSTAARYGETPIAAPRVDFDGDYGQTGLSGRLQAAASVDAGAFEAAADIALDGPAWQARNLIATFDALSLTGSASGTGSEDLRADLSVSAPADVLEGVGALSGDIQLTRTDLNAELIVAGLTRGNLNFGDITLTASGPLAQVTGKLDLAGTMELAGTPRALSLDMPFQIDAFARTARLSPSARIEDTPIETLEPILIAATDSEIDLSGALSMLGGRLDASGSRGEAGLRLNATATDLDASILGRLAGRQALRGTLGAVVSLDGEGERLDGTLRLTLAGIAQARPDAPEVSGTLDATMGSGRLQVMLDLSDSDGAVNLTGSAQLPVEASAEPFRMAVPAGALLQSRFEGRGAIEPIWSIIGPVDTALQGQFELAASVNGPLDDPAPQGRLEVRGGDLEDALVGLHLTGIDMTADIAPEAVTVLSLSALGSRGGRVSGSGRYGFGGTSSVDLELDQLDALLRDDVRAVVSGRLALTDAETGASLSGALRFGSAEVNVDQLPTGGYTTLDVQFPNGNGEIEEVETPERVPVALDIHLDADRRIRIIGAGLETEWRMDANLGGTVRAPFLTGSAELVRGDVEVLGRAFPLAGSAIRFNGPVDEAELAIKAQRSQDGFTAGFLVTGTVGAPQFGLTSSPQVPDDEVLSRALFGTSPSQLSALQAAQLAAGLAQLAGGGGPDLLGGLEDALNVDRIDLGFQEDGTASLGAGKYIAEDVYLEVTTNMRGAPGLGVEWTPRENVEVGAEFGTEVTPRFSIQWTRDYGGPDKPLEPDPEKDKPEKGE